MLQLQLNMLQFLWIAAISLDSLDIRLFDEAVACSYQQYFLSSSEDDGREDIQTQTQLSQAKIQGRQLLCLKLDVQGNAGGGGS